jgi:hypothetical protein
MTILPTVRCSRICASASATRSSGIVSSRGGFIVPD